MANYKRKIKSGSEMKTTKQGRNRKAREERESQPVDGMCGAEILPRKGVL